MIKPKLNLSLWFSRRLDQSGRVVVKGYCEIALRGIKEYEEYINYLELKLKDNNK